MKKIVIYATIIFFIIFILISFYLYKNLPDAISMAAPYPDYYLWR